MGRDTKWRSADEEQPLLTKVNEMAVDSDVKAAASQLNKVMLMAVCCTMIALVAWGHNEYIKSQDPVHRITDLRRRIATAQRALAHAPVVHDCRDGECAKDFLPPMARGFSDEGTNLTDEAQNYVLPAAWDVLLDPEQSYWLWLILALGFAAVLLLTGSLLEATSRKSRNESWFQTEARAIFKKVREADTFKQLCFYNPATDPEQEPGEGNAYRLLAIVGPNMMNILRPRACPGGGRVEDKSKSGFEFTLPGKGAYASILVLTFCLLTMQIYFPYQLITELLGKNSHFKLVGLKKVAYFSDFPDRVWLQLVPLLLMSCKFFVVVERTLRSEFNVCLWLYYATADGKFKYQCFGKYWSYFWITVSLLINFYIGIVMTLYVVVNIAVFDSQGGNLMNFILGIFGSFGLINFDDSIMEALPLWANWYKQHMCFAGHPQGEHPDGESMDEFFGPEGVKETGEGNDVIRWGEEAMPEGQKGEDSDQQAKPMKTKFVTVGLQLTAERSTIGFYYSGTTITKVADDGAAAWAVDMDEVRNGVFRHVNMVFPVDAGMKLGLSFDDEEKPLKVTDACDDGFLAGVRSGYKLTEINGKHVRSNTISEDWQEEIQREGGVLRFHEKARIWDGAITAAGEAPPPETQPIGDGERAPFLYKGKDCSEMAYWEYSSDSMRATDSADGVTMPLLSWPPSTDALKEQWKKAMSKWRDGHLPSYSMKQQKKGGCRETFGFSVDRDSNGLLMVVSKDQGSPAEKLPIDRNFYAAELYHLGSDEKKRALLWHSSPDGIQMTHHELISHMSSIPKHDWCEMVFKPLNPLRKPRATGLEPGMIIHKINGEVVQDQSDVSRILRKLKGDSTHSTDCTFADQWTSNVPWVGHTIGARDLEGATKVKDPNDGAIKEFTMTLLRAHDETSTMDDVVHGVIYAIVRILLFASLLFIMATYYVDETTGHHVGI